MPIAVSALTCSLDSDQNSDVAPYPEKDSAALSCNPFGRGGS